MKRFFLILLTVTTIPLILFAQNAKDSYSSSSVLSSGTWFRISVTSEGVYRIDYSKLKQLGLSFPENPRIFGNNCGQLSYYNDNSQPDDLNELPLYFNKGSDGIFNEGDYILFFAEGTNRWKYNVNLKTFDFIKHNYSDTASYFLTSSSTHGKEVSIASEPSASVNYTTSAADVLYAMEPDNLNLLKSGREWFAEISVLQIDPGFSDLIPDSDIKYNLRVAARAAGQTSFSLSEKSEIKKNLVVQGVNLSDNTGTYFQITDSAGSLKTLSASPVYELKFNNNSQSGAHGYIDRISLHARRKNIFRGTQYVFSDILSAGNGKVTRFIVSSPSIDPVIFDVTDPLKMKLIDYSRNLENLTFNYNTDSLRKFVIFSPANAVTPIIKTSPLANQDLHSSGAADMLVITHPAFRAYAEKLAAIHAATDGLVSQIVTPAQVYNEFSGGITDIVALRNFCRMKYLRQKNTDHPFRYLLLFGDGSYENRTFPPSNPNFIPTYQSQNSNVIVSSFTSDDFYGLLDDGEGEYTGTEDIGIGRLPVADTVQAGIAISKIKEYLDPENMGDWKNTICLVADDEDGNTHMSDAEGLSNVITEKTPEYNIDKIYLDAFKESTTVNGQSYPEVNQAINNRINNGCLIFNYTGHGNETVLAAESVVKAEDINSWKNKGRLPLFITATCEFSRFDDAELNIVTHALTGKPSGGELVFFNKNGGAIALMSTTRVVYSAPNYDLNRNIFSCAFNRDKSGNSMTFGDIIKAAKNNSGSDANKRNFTLLGDPALKFMYPFHGRIVTDSINNASISNGTDSLKALSIIRIAGHAEDSSGKLLDDFNGVIAPVVYDKPSKIRTLANDGGQNMTFSQNNNILFKGKTNAVNGRFSFTFIVPKDIDYNYGQGKISYYANDDLIDLNGSYTDMIVGGFSRSPETDNDGPEIKLFLNDTLFRDGGITDKNPILVAFISDKSGINISGAGIGHDLTGYLDNDPDKSFILNNYFETAFDNYMTGRVTYDLRDISEGKHYLTIKAWDNMNNSSLATISFTVTGSKLLLNNLRNYPNPFSGSTSFTFEHNRPGQELVVVIEIFSLDGRKIRTIKSIINPSGYELPPIEWNCTDESGRKTGRGMYIYTVTVRTPEGESCRLSGRMIIL
jgi:hypothetical protein